jgi:hypothetical protein
MQPKMLSMPNHHQAGLRTISYQMEANAEQRATRVLPWMVGHARVGAVVVEAYRVQMREPRPEPHGGHRLRGLEFRSFQFRRMLVSLLKLRRLRVEVLTKAAPPAGVLLKAVAAIMACSAAL